MKISTHLNAIFADLESVKGDLGVKDIEISEGRFDASEIGRDSFKAPALRVAFLGAPKSKALADTTRKYDAAFAVFVVTDGRGRSARGIDIVEAIAERVELNRFSTKDVGVPKSQRIDALYTSQIGQKGISLFSMSWVQSVCIGTADVAGSEDPFSIDISQPPEGV